MFYCSDCGNARGWPTSFCISRGPCEICGVVATCNDVPSLALPTPKTATPPPPSVFDCSLLGNSPPTGNMMPQPDLPPPSDAAEGVQAVRVDEDTRRLDFLIGIWAESMPLTTQIADVLEAFKAGDKQRIRATIDAAIAHKETP